MTINTENKLVAVFDLDDTLIDLKDALYTMLYENFGDKVSHWSEWGQHNIEAELGISHEHLIELVLEDRTFTKIKPHLFSKYILRELREHDYHVVILTARGGFIPNAFEETETYLAQHDMEYDELIVSPVGQNKVPSLSHHNHIHFTIDDQIKNCQDFRESGKFDHVFLHALPYNKFCTEFTRIHSLYQIFPYIDLPNY